MSPGLANNAGPLLGALVCLFNEETRVPSVSPGVAVAFRHTKALLLLM